MKNFILIAAISFMGCATSLSINSNRIASSNSIPSSPQTTVAVKGDAFQFVVDGIALQLFESKDKCILRYKVKGNDWAQLDTDIAAPCDFVGRKVKNPPQRFKFNTNTGNSITIFLITGGPPYTSLADDYMPDGCGTQLAKVRVYSDRVEIDRESENNQPSSTEPTPYCPSNPLDEVFFATG